MQYPRSSLKILRVLHFCLWYIAEDVILEHSKFTIYKKAYKKVKHTFFCSYNNEKKSILYSLFMFCVPIRRACLSCFKTVKFPQDALSKVCLNMAWQFKEKIDSKRLKIYKRVGRHQTTGDKKRSGFHLLLSRLVIKKCNALIRYLYTDALWPLYALL